MNGKIDAKASNDFADLEALFGIEDEDTKKAENIILSQNLEGFASCFPDWDIHPPVKQ